MKWNSTVKDIAERLNGNKRLVSGNHDIYPEEEYLKYFDRIYGAKSFQDTFLLTHVRYINVSCEQINCTPISLEEIIKITGESPL